MAAVAYGHVAIVPKGIWNADTQYEVCQLVEYDGSSYVAKAQPPVGTLPTDTSYWQVSAAGTKKASSGSLGTVMPDGSTTEVNEEGKLSAKTAQQNALGVVKGSDDITVGEDGNLTVNTTFEQATEIANIIAGEAIKSVLGKVSKAIATTMSLDENALLKNMISGIDVNDGNKVPSSAYIHSLVERIGMGTALEGGFDNLTAGLNSVNNNLSNRIPFDTKPEESSIVNRIISMQKAGCKAAIFCSKNTCSDNPPTAGWYNILYWGLASEQIILASCTWQPKTTYYGVFNLDETAPTITWREIVTKSDLLTQLLGNVKVTGEDARSSVELFSSLPGNTLYFFHCSGTKGIAAELGFSDVNNALCGFIYKASTWRGCGILIPMTGVVTDYNIFVGRLEAENKLKWVGIK